MNINKTVLGMMLILGVGSMSLSQADNFGKFGLELPVPALSGKSFNLNPDKAALNDRLRAIQARQFERLMESSEDRLERNGLEAGLQGSSNRAVVKRDLAGL